MTNLRHVVLKARQPTNETYDFPLVPVDDLEGLIKAVGAARVLALAVKGLETAAGTFVATRKAGTSKRPGVNGAALQKLCDKWDGSPMRRSLSAAEKLAEAYAKMSPEDRARAAEMIQTATKTA